MRIANQYSHLNGYEYMLVHRRELWDELSYAIGRIDANRYVKLSREKTKIGKKLYDQKAINGEFEKFLTLNGWKSVKTPYLCNR